MSRKKVGIWVQLNDIARWKLKNAADFAGISEAEIAQLILNDAIGSSVVKCVMSDGRKLPESSAGAGQVERRVLFVCAIADIREAGTWETSAVSNA